MLVATINPPAKRYIQNTPFSTVEFTGDRMVANCKRLPIGAVGQSPNDKIEFEVRFGVIKYESNLDGTQGPPLFDRVYTTKVSFFASELSNWGTDDSVVYTAIAQKLGFSIVTTEQIDLPFNT